MMSIDNENDNNDNTFMNTNGIDEFDENIKALVDAEKELGRILYERENERKNQMIQKLNVVVAIIIFLAGSMFLLGKEALDLILEAVKCIPLTVAIAILSVSDLTYFIISIARAFIDTIKAMRSIQYSGMKSPGDFYTLHVRNGNIITPKVEIQRSLAYSLAVCGKENAEKNENRSGLYNNALNNLKKAFFSALVLFVITIIMLLFSRIVILIETRR